MDANTCYYSDCDIRRVTISHTDAGGDHCDRHILAIGYVDIHAEAVRYAAAHLDGDNPVTISYTTPDGFGYAVTYPNAEAIYAAAHACG